MSTNNQPIEISIPFEMEESERFETFLENIKYELRGQVKMFEATMKSRPCGAEKLGRIVNLCAELGEMISSFSTNIMLEHFVSKAPNLTKLDGLKGDSGISSSSDISASNLSSKGSENRLSTFETEDIRHAQFSISPSESLLDISRLPTEVNEPTYGGQRTNLRRSTNQPTEVNEPSTIVPTEPKTITEALDEYRLDATSPFVCKTLPSRQGRASILSSASAYCFSATEIAESYKLRVTAENNTCAYFRLVPLSSNSGMSMIKDTGSGHRLSGLTHDLSRLSVASSNDSVIDLTIAEETNVNEKVPKSFVYPMNDLSKKSSESSEEDNTKQRLFSSLTDGMCGIINMQLVRRT